MYFFFWVHEDAFGSSSLVCPVFEALVDYHHLSNFRFTVFSKKYKKKNKDKMSRNRVVSSVFLLFFGFSEPFIFLASFLSRWELSVDRNRVRRGCEASRIFCRLGAGDDRRPLCTFRFRVSWKDEQKSCPVNTLFFFSSYFLFIRSCLKYRPGISINYFTELLTLTGNYLVIFVISNNCQKKFNYWSRNLFRKGFGVVGNNNGLQIRLPTERG